VKLDDLCETFEALALPRLDERAHPAHETVREARYAVETAVVDDHFLADCIASELALIERDVLRQGLVPFYVMPRHGVRFAFGYWPPGATPGPHEHTAWTVTAVCRNELEVFTYDRDESYRLDRLVPKNRFLASAGKVGYIYQPCIHKPVNVSPSWSLSMHISSPRDGELLDEAGQCLPALEGPPEPADELDHPYWSVVRARQRAGCVDALARVLAPMRTARARAALTTCHRLGASRTRQFLRDGGHVGVDTAVEPRVLARADSRLSLHVRRGGGGNVRVEAVTPRGVIEELVVNDLASDALTYAAANVSFDVRSLPGLHDDERDGLADALEDAGLFRRIPQ
jgi:hypothetical protein